MHSAFFDSLIIMLNVNCFTDVNGDTQGHLFGHALPVVAVTGAQVIAETAATGNGSTWVGSNHVLCIVDGLICVTKMYICQ